MGPHVHLHLTRQWAIEAGLADVAERVARADVAVDLEHPARKSLRDLTRHFGPWAYFWVRHHMREALASRSPEALGRALHAAQDAVSHGALGLAHIRHDLRLGRDPDDWEAAPERVRRRIKDASIALLVEYRAHAAP